MRRREGAGLECRILTQSPTHLHSFLLQNGFTHQDPGFLQHVGSKSPDIVRIYLPPDANCLLSCMHHCLQSKHYVNVMVAGKHPSPQWLTVEEAKSHCAAGLGIWPWASNDLDREPDVIVACAGDIPTLESLAGVSLLRKHLPGLSVRFVNVVDLMKLTRQHPHGLSDEAFDSIFTKDRPVLFNFHAYPQMIQHLTFGRRPNQDNFLVRGYREEGTITTPFDMCVLNGIDRYSLVMDVIDNFIINDSNVDDETRSRAPHIRQEMWNALVRHKQHICQHGTDMDEIVHWEWQSTEKQKVHKRKRTDFD